MVKHRPKSFEFTINSIPTDRGGSPSHKKCGDDIDWSGHAARGDERTKICPQCKTWFAPEDEFCEKCPTKVKLMWSD